MIAGRGSGWFEKVTEMPNEIKDNDLKTPKWILRNLICYGNCLLSEYTYKYHFHEEEVKQFLNYEVEIEKDNFVIIRRIYE